MSDTIIELKNIYKSYDSGPQKVEVLNGIDLSLNKGEIVVVMGPSGVGKSTLLHIMGALDLPTSGEIWAGQDKLNELSDADLSKFRSLSIGFVFQFHYLLPEFTALENVLIPAMMHEPLDSEKEEYAKYILDVVGLSKRLEHKPNELSGGEQQRVAVARALINKPKLLLADEPTGNLDKRNSGMLYELLLELNRKFEQTIVIVTHSDELMSKAHRIIELDDGMISADKRQLQ